MSAVAINDEIAPSSPWREWTTRLQAYTDWLNLQLKKHNGNRTITDLRHDLQDGVVVAQLVEALGGERVIGIDPRPSTPASRKENVERIFQHFSTKHVPISYCKAKDVLAGDLKCIMRLIHAVASHYRPESVLHPPNNAPAGHHSRCTTTSSGYICEDKNMTSSVRMTSLMGRQKSEASAPVRKVVGNSALPIRKQPLSSRDCPKLTSTLSSLSLDHKRSPLRKSFTSLACERFSKASADRSNTNVSSAGKEGATKISCKVAPLQFSASTTPAVHCSVIPGSRLGRRKSSVSRSQPCSLDSVDNNKAVSQEEVKKVGTCSCTNLSYDDVEELFKQVKEAKEQLLLLQQVLLHGNGGKFLKDSDHGIPYGSTEEVVTPRTVLNDPGSKDCVNSHKRNRTTEPLSMVKKLINYMSVCGERKGLSLEENTKSKSMGQEAPETGSKNFKEENENLKKAIEEKDQEIKRLKASLSTQMPGFEKKQKYPFPSTTRTQREELQVVHEALTSLRKCFPANDPYQHTLDTIEQSLSALLERVNSLEIGALPPQPPTTTTPETVPASVHRMNYIQPNDAIRRPIPRISGFSIQRHEDPRKSTKVVYYMDKSVTPFRCVLNKRIGEATLRDFKLLFDRPGQYRYHFKTLDPEFGMVKEEVLHDDDLLPGWDGKIIAWIEEDCS